ncbi:MAG: DNA/RNA nuclease SfsA [Nitrososphaerota archaeon]|nr:DNA/RNA nuclease SfsA [Candidatus Bathyarchaeota archaeon]MDW8061598.1 DNA/RNA nuclease SfsA [Nitrososphaerota archaeon]
MNQLLARIDSPVICRIVRRLNRFVVLISVDGMLAKAYLNNTGRLNKYIVEDRLAYSLTATSNRKTMYRLFAVEDDSLAALIDTYLQMKFFEEAMSKNLIPWLKGFRIAKRNVQLHSSFIDYLLRSRDRIIYLEVKSAVMRIGRSFASYPDCPSARGRRHVEDLIIASSKGLDCMILFIAALPYINAFKPNEDADPKLANLLKLAVKVGVGVKAISLYYNPSDSSVYLDNPELKVEV